ncbi:hypothetical protein [Streptomyces globisporus]|uniref:hypothetical protein n=1 Tax=Streptomyces globisporus TaxID=1908 RepID=UPI00368E836E
MRKALSELESAGELAVQRRGRQTAAYRYRLRPEELHPHDVELDRTVREGIRSGRYAVGRGVPTGLLGQEHRVPGALIPRAFRHLVSDGYVAAQPRNTSPSTATRGARR